MDHPPIDREERAGPAGDSRRARRELLAQLLRSRTADAELPLSHNQRSLWILHRLAPESTAYNVPYAWRARSAIDVPALRHAFEELVARHAILRTTYAAADPLQRVHDRADVDFEVLDVAAWSDEGLRTRFDEEIHRPFDLERGPVFRVRLFDGAAGGSVLLVVFHHIAYDLWSMVTLLHEIGAIYAAARAGAGVALPPPAHQYADFVRWQADMLAVDGERLWSYWREQLAGELPVLALPTDRPRPSVQTYVGATYSRPLPSMLAAAAHALARAQETTLFTVLLAAYDVLLGQLSGQTDILIGSPMAGRSRPEFENLIGYFLNVVPLRANLAGDPPFHRFLRAVHRTVRGALEHQDYPFELLVQRLRPPRDPSRPVLFQTMFVLNRPHLREGQIVSVSAKTGDLVQTDLGTLALEGVPLEQRIAQFDVSLEIDHFADSLVARWEYNTDLFGATSVSKWAAHYEALLQAICSRPEARLSELPEPVDDATSATDRR